MTFEVYSTVPYPKKVGVVSTNGYVINLNRSLVGKVYGDGTIVTKDAETLGRVRKNGQFSEMSINALYRIDLQGDIYLQKRRIGRVIQIREGLRDSLAQWAACLLLLAPEESLIMSADFEE